MKKATKKKESENWYNPMIAERLEYIAKGIRDGKIDIVRWRLHRHPEEMHMLSDNYVEFEYRFINKEDK